MDKCQVINTGDLKNSNDTKSVSTERTKILDANVNDEKRKSAPKPSNKELDELYNQSDPGIYFAYIYIYARNI
jgi:hypothetical protein